MRLLTWLLALLMWAPADARASTIQTGIGYVRGECRSIGDSDSHACFSGERLNLGVNFPVKDKDDESSGGDIHVDSPSSSGGVDWSRGLQWSGSNDTVTVIVLTLVIILLLFGIYWFVAGIISRRMSLGLYAAFDFQKAKLTGDNGIVVEKYQSQSTGLQALFYMFRNTDVVLNVGLAAATAQISTTSDVGGDASYNLRGISSKIGLGYVPFEKTGMYAMLELQGTYFDGTSLSKYVKDNADAKLPKIERSAALILGVAF